jgi:hypothetical protein
MPGHQQQHYRLAGNSTCNHYSAGDLNSGNGSNISPEQNYAIIGYTGGLTSRGGSLKWQCCRCFDGWFSTTLDDYCPSCRSARCNNCRYAH